MSYVRENFNKIAIQHDMLSGIYFKQKFIYISKEDLINFICDLEYERYKFIASGLASMLTSTDKNYDIIHQFMRFLAIDITKEIICNREMHKNISLYVKNVIDGEFTLFTIDEIE